MTGSLGDLLRRNPDFRRLFYATLVSLAGDWFSLVAVSGMVTEVTGGDASAALVYAAAVLPVFLLSTPAGVLADRYDRKKLMVASDLLRALPSLGLLAALHFRSPVLAIVCVATSSALSALYEPAALAATPNLVADRDLEGAQAAMGMAWGSMLLVGASLGGIASAALGRSASVILDAATFLVSAALIARIRGATSALRDHASPHPDHGLAALRPFLRERPVVRALLFAKPGVGAANGIVGLLPGYATHRFGVGDLGLGVLLAARGLGALLGPILGRSAASADGRRLLLLCGAGSLLYAAAYAVLPVAPSIAVAAACAIVAHIGGGGQWMLSTVALQRATPDALRGRVLGLDYGIATAAIGVSGIAAAALVTRLDLARATWVLVAIAAVYGLSWLFWTRGLRRGNVDPLR